MSVLETHHCHGDWTLDDRAADFGDYFDNAHDHLLLKKYPTRKHCQVLIPRLLRASMS
jgi:hypothetical protein